MRGSATSDQFPEYRDRSGLVAMKLEQQPFLNLSSCRYKPVKIHLIRRIALSGKISVKPAKIKSYK